MAQVLVYQSSYTNVKQTVRQVFSDLDLDLRGKRVLLKPNALSEREPEMGANTHPALVAAVVAMVEELGASEVMVADNPGQANYGKIRDVFNKNGLGKAAGPYFRNFGLDLVARRLPSIDFDLYFPSLLFEADYVINLPKFKIHPTCGLTGAVKNTFGYLPGAQKAGCHVATPGRRAFEKVLAEIYSLRIPDLSIMDGIILTESRTQGGPGMRYLGKLLVSTSAAALDVLAATMVNLDPKNLWHLVHACDIDGISPDVNDLDIKGEWSVMTDVRLPKDFQPGAVRTDDPASASLIESASRKILDLCRDLCTSCGECERQCPSGALKMVDDYPTVDREKCVSCFACTESCESRAIDLLPIYPAQTNH